MTDSVRAGVLTGPGKAEIQQFPMPEVAEDNGVLRVEASGLVGADYEGMIPSGRRYPAIPGHIIVGRIAGVGDLAAERWGVVEGDRVLMQYDVPCLHCRMCRTGFPRRCEKGPLMYGLWQFEYDKPPYLWGGCADFMALHPNSYMAKLPETADPVRMCLLERCADGHNWLINEGGLTAYDSLVIIGPGALGLAAVIVGKVAGAHPVIVVTRPESRRKELARTAGADFVISGTEDEVIDSIAQVTNGRMGSVVIDVSTAEAQEVTRLAVRAAGFRGRIVQVAVRRSGELTGVLSRSFMDNELTLRNVWGHHPQDLDAAVSLIDRPEAQRLYDLPISTYPLEAIDVWSRNSGSVDGTALTVVVP